MLGAQPLDDGRIEIRVIEQREGEMPLADLAAEGGSLAFSVIRRMVAAEGGRFERRRGESAGDAVTACTFDIARMSVSAPRGGETGQAAQVLPFSRRGA